MGMLSRTASFVRYSVEGEPPQPFWEFAAERIGAYAFRDIDDSFEERSVGWVSVAGLLDREFAEAPYVAGDYLALSLRIDERKVAPKVLEKFCLKEEERLRKERRIPKLNRRDRQEVKENVRLMLLKRAVPVPAVHDMVWNLVDNTVLFFATSQKAQEVFEDLFRQTFGLGVILQVPYLVAERLMPGAEGEGLADLAPSIFV